MQGVQNLMADQPIMTKPMFTGGSSQGGPTRATSASFAARPRVLTAQGNKQGAVFRDPGMIRVAPQNIMHDRRVVRGNTFAALVIPINMQPDATRPSTTLAQRRPMTSLHQRARVMSSKERSHANFSQPLMNTGQQQQRSFSRIGSNRTGGVDQENLNSQNLPMTLQHNYEELSDVENMVDEIEVEADFFIDQAPEAIFIPDSPGKEKCTSLHDEDLFDFDLEVEPILQVLVGKALELAKIEVIEDHEKEIFIEHRKKYQMLRQSELLNSQRVESHRYRRQLEFDSRMKQHQIYYNSKFEADKILIARNAAKANLKFLKMENFQELLDKNCLQSRRKQINGSFRVQFEEQAETQQYTDMACEQITDLQMATAVKRLAQSHQHAIKQEMRRRYEVEKAEKLALIKKEQDSVARKKRRNEQREELRLAQLTDQVIDSAVLNSNILDQPKDAFIFDIGDPISYQAIDQSQQQAKGSIYTFGGLLGELILTFTCLHDYITYNMPPNKEFTFTDDDIENFLVQFIDKEIPQIQIWLQQEPLSAMQEDMDQFLRELMDGQHFSGLGMRFMLSKQEVLGFSSEVVYGFLKKILDVARVQHTIEPTIDHSDSFEAGSSPQKKITALLDKIQVTYFNEMHRDQVEEAGPGQGFIQVRNWREPPIPEHPEMRADASSLHEQMELQKTDTASKDKNVRLSRDQSRTSHPSKASVSASQQQSKERPDSAHTGDESLNIEAMPKMAIMCPTHYDGQMFFVQHTEAVFTLRKMIIETAQKIWPELKTVDFLVILGQIKHKQRSLEQQFENFLIAEHGFDYGMSYQSGVNVRAIYKTFLSHEYEVSLPEVLERPYVQLAMQTKPPRIGGSSVEIPQTI